MRSSRRKFLERASLLAGMGLAPYRTVRGFARSVHGQERSGGRPRALALIGDRYHNADYIRVALDRLFRELDFPIDFTIDYNSISARRLQDYRLFVTLRDGMIWPDGYLEPNDYEYSRQLENTQGWPKETPQPWIREEQGQAIRDFVAAGNGLYAFHNSSNISIYSKSFREVMGGAYIGHPPLRPFRVRIVNHDHPITRGVQDFTVNDEQHYVTYDKDPKDLLLKSENLDGLGYRDLGTQSIAGWAYEFGKGRVVFTAPGHTLHAMWQPEYLKIQKNAVRWLLRTL